MLQVPLIIPVWQCQHLSMQGRHFHLPTCHTSLLPILHYSLQQVHHFTSPKLFSSNHFQYLAMVQISLYLKQAMVRHKAVGIIIISLINSHNQSTPSTSSLLTCLSRASLVILTCLSKLHNCLSSISILRR